MSDLKRNFEGLFKSQFITLCNAANSIIKNKKAAEDIVQDVFLKLWQKKDSIVINSNLKGYLYRTTTHASIDYLNNNKNVIPLKLTAPIQYTGANAEQIIIQKELEQNIDRAIRLLPPRCRTIFALSRFEGMKYREIAEHLDISEKTVENQMGIALEKLRIELKPFFSKKLSTVPKIGQL